MIPSVYWCCDVDQIRWWKVLAAFTFFFFLLQRVGKLTAKKTQKNSHTLSSRTRTHTHPNFFIFLILGFWFWFVTRRLIFTVSAFYFSLKFDIPKSEMAQLQKIPPGHVRLKWKTDLEKGVVMSNLDVMNCIIYFRQQLIYSFTSATRLVEDSWSWSRLEYLLVGSLSKVSYFL